MIITVSKNGVKLDRLDFSDQVIPGQSSAFLIGRSETAHIHLVDPQISRELANLIFDGTSWRLKRLSDYDTILLNNAPMLVDDVQVSSGYFLACNEYKVIFEELEVPSEQFVEQIEEANNDDSLENEVLEPTEDEISSEDEETAVLDQASEELPDSEEVTSEFSSFENDNTQEDVGDYQEQGFDDAELGDGEYIQDDYIEGEGYDQDGYESDGYGIEALDDDGDVGDATQVFSGFANFVLELFGEDVPYDDFNLDQPETYIGRDPAKCQIVLNDPEVSSVHAVIKKNKITCVLEDLQSANGTILNGKRVNSKEITNGDEFIIGSTTFTVRIASDFIKSQQDMLMPVADNQEVEIEEVIEVSDDDEEFDELVENSASTKGEKLNLKAIMADPEKRKKYILYPLVGVVLAYTLFGGSGDDSSQTQKAKQAKVAPKKKQVVTSADKKLTKEQEEKAEALYQLATRYANEGNVGEAITEFERLFLITKDYKQAQTFYQLAKDKYAELEKAELERRAEEKRQLIQAKVKKLLTKAEKAVKERNITLSRGLFQQIKELDPNNYDVANLELELNAYIKEKNQKELVEAQKKAERQRMVDALKPGEKLYLQEEWFKAIGALEIFISEKSIDEDLMTKAVEMLKKARQNLKNITGPLLGKARSLKEAEDLKASYEVFKEVLKYNPNEVDAQAELDEINDTLTKRAQKVYRQGLISESLGAFEDAREKFQEVQQISPMDNEYYKKAKLKLRNL